MNTLRLHQPAQLVGPAPRVTTQSPHPGGGAGSVAGFQRGCLILGMSLPPPGIPRPIEQGTGHILALSPLSESPERPAHLLGEHIMQTLDNRADPRSSGSRECTGTRQPAWGSVLKAHLSQNVLGCPRNGLCPRRIPVQPRTPMAH